MILWCTLPGCKEASLERLLSSSIERQPSAVIKPPAIVNRPASRYGTRRRIN